MDCNLTIYCFNTAVQICLYFPASYAWTCIFALSYPKSESCFFNPSWLLQDPKMKLRTTYKGFTKAVNQYFDQLIPRIAPFQVKLNYPSLWPREVNCLNLLDCLDRARLLSIIQKQEVYIKANSNSLFKKYQVLSHFCAFSSSAAQLDAFFLELHSVYFCFISPLFLRFLSPNVLI